MPTPKATPKPVAYSTKGFTTHEYAASDSKKIYYFSSNGIHCMNKNGSGDTLTSIVKFEYFLAFNTHGLFYVTPNDENYADSVMVYDSATQATTLIKDHVIGIDPSGNSVVTLGNKIYMMDDRDHSHIICYDMSKETMTDIQGLPSKFKDPLTEIDFDVENGHVYLADYDEGVGEYYLITGNKVKACAQPPEDTADTDISTDAPDSYDYNIYYKTGDGVQFKLDDQTNTLAIWTGSEYDDLDIPNVSNVIVSGKNLYVLSYKEKDNWPKEPGDDDTLPSVIKGSPYALYSVSSDGTCKSLCKGVDKFPHDSGLDDGAVCEMIGGWYFAFWETDYGDSGGITGLLLKKKVA